MILLGVGFLLEKSAWLTRVLLCLLAVVALALHLTAVGDLFSGSDADPGIGIWLTAIGYVAIAVGVVLPYRRVTATHITTVTAHNPPAR